MWWENRVVGLNMIVQSDCYHIKSDLSNFSEEALIYWAHLPVLVSLLKSVCLSAVWVSAAELWAVEQLHHGLVDLGRYKVFLAYWTLCLVTVILLQLFETVYTEYLVAAIATSHAFRDQQAQRTLKVFDLIRVNCLVEWEPPQLLCL